MLNTHEPELQLTGEDPLCRTSHATRVSPVHPDDVAPNWETAACTAPVESVAAALVPASDGACAYAAGV